MKQLLNVDFTSFGVTQKFGTTEVLLYWVVWSGAWSNDVCVCV